MIASWNQDHALANSACITKSIVATLPWKLNNLISKGPLWSFRNSLLWDYFVEITYELRLLLETLFNILELSLVSYIGIFFIIVGLIVRVDLKFSMQKDL